MPLYEYSCTNDKCKEAFEKRVSLEDIKNEVKVLCPKCETEASREITGLRSPSTTWKHWRL